MSKTSRIFILVEDSRGQQAIYIILKRLIECAGLLCNCRQLHGAKVHRVQKFKGPCNQSSRMQVKSLKVLTKMRDEKPLILVFIDTDVYRDYNDMVEKVCMHVRDECRGGALHVIPGKILVATGTATGSCRDPESVLSRLLGHKYEKTFADRLAPRLEKSLSDCRTVASLAKNIRTLRIASSILCEHLCGKTSREYLYTLRRIYFGTYTTLRRLGLLSIPRGCGDPLLLPGQARRGR